MEAANNALQLPVYFCDSIMCRLCGCTGSNVSFILLKESCYLAKKIHCEAGVNIKDTDILPKTVCGGCAEKVDLIRHFKRHCKKTQRVLQEMYEQRYHRAVLQEKDAPVLENTENSEVVVVDDDDNNDEKVVVEFINNPLENTSVQNNTVNNVYPTVPTAIIYYNKVLGQMTKPRVQTYSKEELQQLSTQRTEEEEIPEEINDDESDLQNDESDLQNDDSESLIVGELELTDMIVKTETEITVENAPHKTKESEEQMQLGDTSNSNEDKFYEKIEIPTNNSPLLYTLLTHKKSEPEPDFILPHQNFETFEEQNTALCETTEKTNQSTVDVDSADDDVEIIENKLELDDEQKLDTFIISKVVSTPETVDETEPNTRTDKSGKTFSSNSLKYVKEISDKEYACTICDEKFRYPFQAEIHVRRHLGELPFKCKKCEKCFVKAYNLLKHERTHTTGQYICEICGKSFHESYAIKDHQRTHTDPKPEFKCCTCDKEFFTKENFESHKLIHAEKKHICEICGKIFPLHSMMRRHQARHNEDTVFKCNLCPKISKTKDQHMQHRKRHDEQGNFYCKPCSLPFWTLKGLHVHETVAHNGDVVENTDIESPSEIQNEQEDK